MVVDASASFAWKLVTGRLTKAQRADVTLDPNLWTICENVETIGRCEHNGVEWDRQHEFVADDNAISFTPPKAQGIVEVYCNGTVGLYIKARYTMAPAVMEILSQGSEGTVVTTDGTLTGLDGTDGFLSLRADNASQKIYFENRSGGNRNLMIIFGDAIPD